MSERDRSRREPPRDPSESVRIIGADEAAEVLDRGDAQRRLESGEVRHGDRPAKPPVERPVPALRFPLDGSADLEGFQRPSAVPVSGRRQVAPELAHWAESAPEEVPNMSPHDPYHGDEPGDESEVWSAFAGAGPRWRDDQPGRPGQVPPERPTRRRPSQQGEPVGFDDYQEPSSGRSVFDDVQAAAEGHVPGSYEDNYQDQQSFPDQGYVTRSAFTTPYDDSYTHQPYDDSYSDDFYTEPEPPSRAAAGRPRPQPTGPAPRAPQRRSAARSSDRDMRAAVGVGGGLALTALVLFQVGPLAVMLLVTALVGVASLEYFTATQRAGFDPLMPVGVAATVGLALTSYYYGQPGMPLVLVLTVAVCLVWYLVGAGGERPMANVGATLLGVGWIGLFGSYAGLLLGAENGVALFVAAVVPTVGYDVGGLFVGRSAGSRPLSEASPNKTMEGLLGGMVLAVVCGLLLGMVGPDPFDFGDGLKIGLVAALVAPLGDLSQSLLKRDLGIKDMGTILPGHGGILDRFDALLFVMPAIWYLAVVSDFFLP